MAGDDGIGCAGHSGCLAKSDRAEEVGGWILVGRLYDHACDGMFIATVCAGNADQRTNTIVAIGLPVGHGHHTLDIAG